MTIPGVRNCGAHIGQAFNADEVVGVYFGENWISIDPAVDYDKTLAAVHEVVEGYPGIVRDVQTYLKERIREVLTGASNAVVVRLYGDDLALLRSKAAEIQAIFDGTEGAIDAHTAPAKGHSADQCRGRSGKGPELRAEAGRRPAGRGNAGGR